MTSPNSPRLDAPPADGANLARDLGRIGWLAEEEPASPRELFFQTFQGVHRSTCHRFRCGGGARLLLLDLSSVVLASEEELFSRFLNIALETRLALAAAHLMGAPDWVLLLTHQRIDLHRLPDEACEQRALTLAEYENELLPALAALAGGRGETVCSSPQHLPGAESLGEWLKLWSMQLASAVEAPTEMISRMIWKWILMLQAARRTDGSEALGGWGLSCSRRGDAWTIAFEAPTASEELSRQIELFDQTFATKLFGIETEQHQNCLKFLEETALIDRLRAELLMHSQERMTPETVAWLFTDLAREQKGWQREVGGVEPMRRRLQHEGWNIFRPLTCHVGKFGLLAALRDAEQLAQYLNEQNLYTQQRRSSGSEAPLVQPDFFCPSPRGIGATGLLDDGVNFMFGEALRLKGVPREERFGVGVTMLLKALALAQQMEWPFFGVETLDTLFLD